MTGMVEEDRSPSPFPPTPSPLQHFSLMPITPPTLGGSPYPWLLGSAGTGNGAADLSSADRGLLLIHLLVNCANHVASRNFEAANAFLEHISALASPDGDTMQRLASYFTDALACRLLKSLPGVYRALHGTRPSSPAESLLARRHFFDLCPFYKLAIVVANKAIVEAMEGERMVHVIDLHAWDPSQWIALLHMLAARPEGPPHLRITGVHDQKEILDSTAARLSEEAERLDVPFQFNPVLVTSGRRLSGLDADALRVKTGEALAISSLFQLHRLLAPDDDDLPFAARPPSALNTRKSKSPSPDDASFPSPPIDSFLSTLWGMSPKIVVVAEQESSHNKPALTERFTEALNYYAALFDCLESTVARASAERARVEKSLLGEEVRNIIACEGAERKERHERAEWWGRRLEAAGFGRVGLSCDGLYQARLLLQSCRCEGYKVREEGGGFMLCWHSNPLFSVSAWKCRRFD